MNISFGLSNNGDGEWVNWHPTGGPSLFFIVTQNEQLGQKIGGHPGAVWIFHNVTQGEDKVQRQHHKNWPNIIIIIFIIKY